MKYSISRQHIGSQFIQVKLQIPCRENEVIQLQLAAWRPGRYELADYAQKIRGFSVWRNNQPYSFRKLTKDLWEFNCLEEGEYEVAYEFYCNQLDAGGCWSDEDVLYLNFSNFVFYIPEKNNSEISIYIEYPKDFIVATALGKTKKNTWKAKDYQELIDSPWLAAKNLIQNSFQIGSTNFHLWLYGQINFDLIMLSDELEKVGRLQIESFGEFPEENYHFIYLLLPYRHYHGVEHARSTVIVYGPSGQLNHKNEFEELMGVSSHELYHAWNVCRIRPKSLLPYDLSKETYLEEGFILEGVTTYLGDFYLLKSGFFSLERFFEEIQKRLQKESDNLGWKNESIVQSSLDLWLDGYKKGIPEKKVNIYNRGSLLALCLDILLVERRSSLEQLMKQMWLNYGKPGKGYTFEDFVNCCTQNLKEPDSVYLFFKDFIFGKNDLLEFMQPILQKIGVRMELRFEGNLILHDFGIRLDQNNQILQIHPQSPAYSELMVGDKILNLENEEKNLNKLIKESTIELKVQRMDRILTISLIRGKDQFFPIISLQPETRSSIRGKWIEVDLT